MMAFDAPAPGAFGSWLAKEGHEIPLRIAGRPITLFEVAEDFLQTHDGGRFNETALAHGGTQQCVCEVPLGRCHFLEGKPFAVTRNEAKVEALIVLQSEDGLGLLVGSQRFEKVVGGLRHLFGRGRCRKWNGAEPREKEQGEEESKGFHGGSQNYCGRKA